MEIAHVMAAARDLGPPRAVIETGIEPQAKRGAAADRNDTAHEQQRTERASAVGEARREIGDARDVAGAIDQLGFEDRGFLDVTLARFDEVRELDAEATGDTVLGRLPEQRVQHRIAVGPRHAAPHDVGRAIDQRVERAVADQAELETRALPLTPALFPAGRGS